MLGKSVLKVAAGALLLVPVGVAVQALPEGCRSDTPTTGPQEVRGGIWSIEASGKGTPVKVGHRGGSFDISPDGTQVVSIDENERLILQDFAETSTPRVLAVGRAADPGFAPDGKTIGFTLNGDSLQEVALVGVDGTGQAVVTSGPGNKRFGGWSQDGRQIAIVNHRVGGPHEDSAEMIQVIDLDGKVRHTVVGPTKHMLYPPAWSVDGRLAYARYPNDDQGWLETAHPDSSDTDRLSPCRWERLPGEPDWSPDGARIVFNDGYGIVVTNADGSHKRRLTHNTQDYNPTWSPDGTLVYFSG